MGGTNRRHQLGTLVAERRQELGLSVSRAAADAGIHRTTWAGLETGMRETESYNYGPVERVLRWRAGSVESVLRGGNPAILEQELPAATSDVEMELAAIADNPRRSPHLREWARSQLVQLSAIRAAAEAEAKASGERTG
jgi:transcriptional regulator with XRE-family HTH domain